MRISSALAALMWLSLCGLSACNKPATSSTQTAKTAANFGPDFGAPPVAVGPDTASVSTLPGISASATSTVAGPISCADEIGATAAGRLVKMCLNMSGATHPPCNAENTCAVMQDEIARSCAMSDGGGHPAPECTPDPKSPEAAAAVVTRYYSALNAHDYDTAWRQWGDNGPPNQTLEKFTAGFAHTRSTHVTIGKLPSAEGAAGSIYQTVPVIVDATLDDGTRQKFSGEYDVRRVNGVDGATPDQLRWHIGSAHLTAAK